MGFTPTIIINYDQLLKKETEIDAAEFDADIDKDEQEAYKTLQETIKLSKEHGYLKFPNHKLNLAVVYSNLTSRNQDIRELLDELEIEYQLDN